MCYSAMVKQHLKGLSLEFKARIDEASFRELFKRRASGEKLKLPRAMESNFTDEAQGAWKDIHASIEVYRAQASVDLQSDLFSQKKRLAEAERAFAAKPTQTSEKEIGVATRKVEAIQRRLDKLNSVKESPEDSRIYALEYAPVILVENGERVIKPMRYLCRPAGYPASFDKDYPGCYNARSDSLKRFWKKQFRHKHAIIVISSFFENVKDESGKSIVVQFFPKGFERMIVPCIWDQWSSPGALDLYSFALITGEPTPEIRKAGHDRCPIFIKDENVERWLNPNDVTEGELDSILLDKQLSFYGANEVTSLAPVKTALRSVGD